MKDKIKQCWKRVSIFPSSTVLRQPAKCTCIKSLAYNSQIFRANEKEHTGFKQRKEQNKT